MNTETLESGLTAAETAYFESGGTTPLAPETEPQKAETDGKEALQAEAQEVEQKEDTKPDRDEKGRFVPSVPHQVFHAEREERKRSAAQVEEAQRKLAAFEERMKWAKESEQPKDDMPPEDDPIGQLQWLKERELERREEARRAQEEEAQSAAANEQWTRHYQSVESAYNAAAAEDPTLDEAFIHVRDSYANELRAQGYTPQQVQHYVNQYGIQFVNTIATRGLDPAKFVKDLAASRGWTGPKKADPVTTAADTIKKVADAQSASRTVAQGGSGAGGDETTLEGILAMPRNEFEVWHSDPKNARLFNRLMGG